MGNQDPNIDIKIKVTGTQDGARDLGKTADELKKLTSQTDKATEAAGKMTGRWRTAAGAIKGLASEFPLLGAAIHAIRSPITLAGTLFVTIFVKAREAIKQAREEQNRYNEAIRKVTVSIDAYSDLKRAIDSVTESQKTLAAATANANKLLEDQLKLTGEKTEGEISILDAEEERQAAIIERDVPEGPERERRLKENKLKFQGAKLALKARLTGQTAQAIAGQIAAEKRLQVDAGEAVPDEAELRATVNQVESDRVGLQSAMQSESGLKRKRELANLAIREGEGVVGGMSLSAPQFNELLKLGLVAWKDKSTAVWQPGAARAMLPGLESELAATQDSAGRLRSSMNAGIGSLPAGVARAGDIPGYISTAESKAAETQNASYLRQQDLQARLDSTIRGGANAQAVGGIQLQTERIRGGGDAGDPLGVAGQIRNVQGDNNMMLLQILKTILQDGRVTAEELRRLQEYMRSHSQGQRP